MALREVIKRVLRNESLDSSELQTLASWLLSEKGRDEFQNVLQSDRSDLSVDQTIDYDRLLKQIHVKIDKTAKQPTKNRFHKYIWMVSSAAILAIGLFCALFFKTTDPSLPLKLGGHKAILTLSDGSDILLSREQAQQIREGETVIDVNNNQIAYTGSSNVSVNNYNTLSVQRGGEYTVTLADGTVVWINSDSKLTYPMQFTGDERRVFLVGEAYFEVTHNPDKPFIVEIDQQRLQVLGTEFNISAYADEPTVTTLVKGSVNLTNVATFKQRKLVPGEQASMNPLTNDFTVNRVNVEDVISWKKGLFVFNDNTLGQVMTKLERWYDISVSYTDPKAKEIVFKGNLPRYLDLKTLLGMIEKISPARFQITQENVSVTLK